MLITVIDMDLWKISLSSKTHLIVKTFVQIVTVFEVSLANLSLVCAIVS